MSLVALIQSWASVAKVSILDNFPIMALKIDLLWIILGCTIY